MVINRNYSALTLFRPTHAQGFSPSRFGVEESQGDVSESNASSPPAREGGALDPVQQLLQDTETAINRITELYLDFREKTRGPEPPARER